MINASCQLSVRRLVSRIGEFGMNRMRLIWRLVAIVAIVLHATASDAQTPEPELVRIPSGQVVMFGPMFVGEGAGPRPTLIMLLGHPAWSVIGRNGARENVLELAQPLQRAGFNVVSFNYRGSWGSAGTYGLLSRIEDTKAALAFVKSEAAARYRVDPARVAVLGHSLGGWNALINSVEEPGVRCTVAIAPASGGSAAVRLIDAGNPAGLDQPIPGLGGYTVRDMRRESVANQPRVEVAARLATLKGHPLLIVEGKQDKAPTVAEAVAAYVTAAVAAAAAPFDHVQIDGGHNFEGNRKELASLVVGWMTRHCM